MNIKGFIRNSLIEWEGKIVSVVFLPYCNLRCRYCHAGHLIVQPEQLDTIDRREVLDYLTANVGWLDGVAITGGEPTLHAEELIDLIQQFRSCPMQVMVETNGTNPDMVQRLIRDGLVEALSMDLKAPLTPEDYRRVTDADVNVEDVARSVQIIKASGVVHELRVTVVPGLVGRDELERMLPVLEGAQKVALQNFKPDQCLCPQLRSVTPFAAEEMDALQQLVAPIVGRCVVRGRDHAALARSSRG